MTIEVDTVLTIQVTDPTTKWFPIVRVKAIVQDIGGAVIEDNVTVDTFKHFPLLKEVGQHRLVISIPVFLTHDHYTW